MLVQTLNCLKPYTRSSATLMLSTRCWNESKGCHRVLVQGSGVYAFLYRGSMCIGLRDEVQLLVEIAGRGTDVTERRGRE